MFIENIHSLFIQMNNGDSGTKSNAIHQLENWYSSLIFHTNAADIIAQTADQDFLVFVAALLCRKIEFVHDTIDDEYIAVMFQTILTRLHDTQNQLRETAQVLLIRIISSICLLWRDYFANWESLINETFHYISIFLVEYIQHPLFAYYLVDLDKDLILSISLNTLANQPSDDPYWVKLLDASLYLTPDITIFQPFIEKLRESTQNPESIPYIITYIENLLAAEFIDQESENEFYSQIIVFALQLAEQLFEPETYMQTSTLLATVISFTPSFYAAEENEEFTKEVLEQYIGAMGSFLSEQSDEMNDEFRAMCDAISVLITGLPEFDRTSAFEGEILATIQLMCSFINSFENYNYKLEPQFFDAFKSILSLDCLQNLNETLQGMYTEMVSNGEPDQALFYCTALNSQTVQNFAVPLINFIIENHVVLISSVFFLSAAAKYANDLRSNIIFFIFTEFETDPQLLSDAILSMSIHYTYLFYDNAEQLIEPLVEMSSESDLNVKSNLILAMLITFPKVDCPNETKEGLLSVIGDNIAYTIDELTSVTEISELIQNVEVIYHFVHKLMSTLPRVYPSVLPYYTDLFHNYFSIIEGHINSSIWTINNEEIQETLCMIVDDALTYNWANSPQQYMDWISHVIYSSPVPKHFNILARLVHESQPDAILLFVQSFDQSNPDVQVMVINYIAKIAKIDVQLLFQVFPVEFLLSPLVSSIPNVISAGLDFILVLIELQIDESLYSHIAETIISVIHNYGASEIDRAMYVLVYLSQKYDLMEYILSLFAQKIGEGPLQTQFFTIFNKTVKREIFCKEPTMTPLYEITRCVLKFITDTTTE